MSIEFDVPEAGSPESEACQEIDAAEVFARYWNDREPTQVNYETISWWLRQARVTDSSC